MEGYINLFEQEDYAGTNRPHYKGYLKIDGVDHEFALWPNKEGKKGFSGKFKPKQVKAQESSASESFTKEAEKVFPAATVNALDDEIPF